MLENPEFSGPEKGKILKGCGQSAGNRREVNKMESIRKTKYLRHYLLGFTDGEGCFSISLKKEDTARFGWVLDPLFQITQHKLNSNVLQLFKEELKCGRIIEKPGQPDLMLYLVDNRRQLIEKVIPFFNKYKLLLKNKDFELFKTIVQGLESKMHFQKETFIELVKQCFEMNMEGKQRRYKLQEIIEDIEKRVLRDYTPNTENFVKI